MKDGEAPAVPQSLVAIVQKDHGKNEDANHHGEAAGVVRIGGQQKALVLGMAQRSHRDLRGKIG